MTINWPSFFIGGAAFIVGFLAIMAWFVPDAASRRAMTWIATRRNFSKVGFGAGIVALVTFLVMAIIAVIKLLHYVQMASWVWAMLWVGSGLFLICLIILLVTRRRNNQQNRNNP